MIKYRHRAALAGGVLYAVAALAPAVSYAASYIGVQTVGGSFNNLNHDPASGNNVACVQFTMPAGTWQADTVSGYHSGSGSDTFAIWNVPTSVPTTLVSGSAAGFTVSGTGWATSTYAGTLPQLLGGQTYCVGYVSGSLSTNYFYTALAGGSQGTTATDSTATDLVTSSNVTEKPSFYITYEAYVSPVSVVAATSTTDQSEQNLSTAFYLWLISFFGTIWLLRKH